MTEITIDREAVEQRIVEQAGREISESYIEGGLPDLRAAVQDIVRDEVAKRCTELVTPIIAKGIEEFEFSVTNRFGEANGSGPTTLTEYIVGLADEFLQHAVDFQGKPKSKNDYGYKDSQTRLTYMIKEHLKYSIKTAMKDAVEQVIKNVAPALAATCEIQIKTVTDDILKRRR